MSSNHLVSLAFALVENETAERWGWFMKWFRNNVIKSNRLFSVAFLLNEQEPEDAQLPMRRESCTCQKLHLTGIPLEHTEGYNCQVCQKIARRSIHRSTLEHTEGSRYIYSGVFHSYGDEDDWPHVSGPKVVPDKNLINRGRRKKVRATMVMDEMEGTSRRTSRWRRRNRQRITQESEPSQPS